MGPNLSLAEQKLCGKPDSWSFQGFILHLLFLKHAPWEFHPVSQMAYSEITYGSLPERASDRFAFLHIIIFPLLF
jgi:hypothetical protein